MTGTRADTIEQIKLAFEAMKQLTTLNAGSIVVIGTFLSNIFPTDKQGALAIPLYNKLLIAAAFVGFGASLIFSVVALLNYQAYLELHLEGGARYRTSMSLYSLPGNLFLAGTLLFGTAVVLNLFFGG
jgi:hypothetical protein